MRFNVLSTRLLNYQMFYFDNLIIPPWHIMVASYRTVGLFDPATQNTISFSYVSQAWVGYHYYYMRQGQSLRLSVQ